MPRSYDLTGYTFEHLTVIERDLTATTAEHSWWCRCLCGNTVSVRSYMLRKKRTRSCGCLRHKSPVNFLDLTEKTFTRLTVIARDLSPGHPEHSVWWICQCICGRTTVASTRDLQYKSVKSCGCLRDELLAQGNLKHGQNRKSGPTPEYSAWQKMKERCYSPECKDYPRYGGRGIVICERWRTSFEAFFKDVGPRPSPKYSLDRYPNNNGPYEPGNVRWATRTEQARNTRSTVFLTLNDETHCLSEWSEILHIKHTILVERHCAGWSAEKILTTPVRQWPSHITNNIQGSLF
jgi:hypothetical protein